MENESENMNLEITAVDTGTDGGSVKVKGVAYSGGEIMQHCGRCIVNVEGIEFAPQIPLMDSHMNDPEFKLGEVKPSVSNGILFVEGSITSKTDLAKQIVEDGKASKWQLSIGAGIKARHDVAEGQKETINGKTVTGPIVVVDKSILREVSVVAIGADKDTSMEIAARLDLDADLQCVNKQTEGENKMAENNQNGSTPEVKAAEHQEINAAEVKAAAENAVIAERKRIADISAVCAGEYNDIQAQAITEGWDVNKVRAEVLNKIRASRPNVGVNVNTGVNAVGKDEIECALCIKSGIKAENLAKDYGEATVDAAMKISDISLKEVVHECIKLSGGNYSSRVGMNDDDIKAAFSTVSLPGILSNVANKVMLKNYMAQAPAAYRLCSTGSLSDFKESNRYRLTDMGNLEQVAPDGEIKSGSVKEEHAKNQLNTYGKKFVLTRQMIIDDDLGAFTKIPAMMGQRAAKLVDQLFFSRLISNPTQEDGVALFHANHRNLISTSGTFGKESLEAAIQMFENQIDADGQFIAATPRKLLVPTALKFKAKELLHSALMIAAGSSDVVRPAYNVLSDENLEIVSSPYLTNTADWYLFGDPAEIDTFEIGFLKGKSTPTIQQGDTDYNTLGMWFRVFFDIGVREQDHRGVLKVIGG